MGNTLLNVSEPFEGQFIKLKVGQNVFCVNMTNVGQNFIFYWKVLKVIRLKISTRGSFQPIVIVMTTIFDIICMNNFIQR